MKKFLIYLSVIAVLVLGAYKFYPTQTKLAQSTLAVAGKNLRTAIVLSVESLGNRGANNTAQVVTQKNSSDVGGSKTKEVSKPAQHVVYTGSSAAVAPANATCFINTTTGQSERVSPVQWNAFVKQHPNYVRGVTFANGTPVYVASAPNLLSTGTSQQSQSYYYIIAEHQVSASHAVPYGTFEAAVQSHEGEGWKVVHHGNEYVLLAPGMGTTFADGTKVTN